MAEGRCTSSPGPSSSFVVDKVFSSFEFGCKVADSGLEFERVRAVSGPSVNSFGTVGDPGCNSGVAEIETQPVGRFLDRSSASGLAEPQGDGASQVDGRDPFHVGEIPLIPFLFKELRDMPGGGNVLPGPVVSGSLQGFPQHVGGFSAAGLMRLPGGSLWGPLVGACREGGGAVHDGLQAVVTHAVILGDELASCNFDAPQD